MKLLIILTLINLVKLCCCAKQPHILFILADDLGYNDVGYHGSEVLTPNIDKLASEGVKFENYYVQPICTPSRSQLMTGRYQIRTGLQHYVINGAQPLGLPLNETILPQLLKKAGYQTHGVGKWHLGFFKTDYFPTNRGFDSFYGYMNGMEDYYTKKYKCTKYVGYDFYDDLFIDTSANGTFSNDLFTTRVDKIVMKHDKNQPLFMYLPFQSVHAPNEVPQKYLDMYSWIKDGERRSHVAMITALDDSVQKVVESFKAAGLWNDTLLVFSTDNGGYHGYGGSNWPYRGEKVTLWEGGMRGVAFARGAGLNNQGTINKEFFHISDWFQTLLNVGGAPKPSLQLDGYDVWETVSNNKPSPRKELLHNIDPIYGNPKGLLPYKNKYNFDTTKGHSAIRVGKWKLLTGYPGNDAWFPRPPHKPNMESVKMNRINYTSSVPSTKSLYLFDIDADPQERQEVSAQFPDVVDDLLQRLVMYNKSAVPVNYPPYDPKCDPSLYGGFWVPWQ